MKTKTYKSFLSFSCISIVISILLFFSCNKDENQISPEQGTIQFSLLINESDALKSASLLSTNPASALIVSVENSSGIKIFTKKNIPLIRFGEEYITDPVSLETGEYNITDYMVIDKDGLVIYATPKEGSPNQGSVGDPLPVSFFVKSNKIQNVSPEVITSVNASPKDFGYETFSFDIVNTYEFLIGVFTYNDKNKAISLLGSTLTVSAGSDVLYSGTLNSVTNLVVIPSNKSEYKVTVRLNGYTTYEKTFTKIEFKAYTNPDGLPLVVMLAKSNIINTGLIFWNKLGSSDEIANSVVGTSGLLSGGSFIPGVFGNALCTSYDQDNPVKFIDSGIFSMQQGCIEFWGKLINVYPILTVGDPGFWYEFFLYKEGDGNAMGQSINANNGLSSGGVSSAVRNKGYNYLSSCGTQEYTWQIPLTDIYGSETELWHHYAVVWNSNGLQGIDNGNRRIVMFLDGIQNTAFWHTGYVGDYIPWEPADASLTLLNNNGPQGSMAIDNIKIWNYSKTDFSDRFVE